jgi:hypothetical protein
MTDFFSTTALIQLQQVFGGGTAIIQAPDLTALTEAVRELNQTMDSVLRRLENPTQTAGDELTRRAALALRNEWYQDASSDATRSIEAYPYTPVPYLISALASIGQGDLGEAVNLLRRGIPYAKVESCGHAVVMALLGSRLGTLGGSSEISADFIREGNKVTDYCSPALVLTSASDDSERRETAARAAELLKCDPGAFYGLAIPDAVAKSEAWQSVQIACDEFQESLVRVTTASAHFADRFRYDDGEVYAGGAGFLGPYAVLARHAKHDAIDLPHRLLILRKIVELMYKRMPNINSRSVDNALGVLRSMLAAVSLRISELAQEPPPSKSRSFAFADKLDVSLARAVRGQELLEAAATWPVQPLPRRPKRWPLGDRGNQYVAKTHYEEDVRLAKMNNDRRNLLIEARKLLPVPDAQALITAIHSWAISTDPTGLQVVRPPFSGPSLPAGLLGPAAATREEDQ